MAEAEDVITDVARHATAFAQQLWRRHRPPVERGLALADVTTRLQLLSRSVFGRDFRIAPAQLPAPRTWLDKLMRAKEAQPATVALPATDGATLWLPRVLDGGDGAGLERYRLLALQQAMRAVRGSAIHYPFDGGPVLQALYHIGEAQAADAALIALMPGLMPALQRWRADALAARTPLAGVPPMVRPFEERVRAVLACPIAASGTVPVPAQVLAEARVQAGSLTGRGRLLAKDAWLGELLPPPSASVASAQPYAAGEPPARSARLARRPQVREPDEDEDDTGRPGPTMVQPSQPHEQAEDAPGMQRPTDRDTGTAAEDFADALSELPEARLVASPGAPREVLLSEDPPPRQGRSALHGANAADARGDTYRYPEWDCHARAYREPGATVTVHTARLGEQGTVDAILRGQASALMTLRRHFELLRAHRTRLRRQFDGTDIDLQGWIDNQALLRSGGTLEQRLYEGERRDRRDMAVTLLVDISGSTDGWVSGQRRVIDVEREALLMVCVALDALGDPFSVLGFSGEGPAGVVVRAIKHFHERYDAGVALRIAGLEPEHYTRAGAAVRHATAELMRQAAGQRLLIVLSDGKPNDLDEYDGRYGVEDLRQAVVEARLQGITPFCLTIDRQAAGYLGAVFGEHAFALLHQPERLPDTLLGWLRRLLTQGGG